MARRKSSAIFLLYAGYTRAAPGLLRLVVFTGVAAAGSAQDIPPNIRVTLPETGSANEVSVDINPVNPMEIAAGSNLRFFYRSTDGGWTWKQSQLPPGTWGDPSVAFDHEGRLYYAHLANISRSIDPQSYFIDRLIVHRSTDGGQTWLDSAEVGYTYPRQQDKEWLVADRTFSPYRGHLYMSWTEFDSYGSPDPGDSTRILFARSTDGGGTWSVPLRLSDRGGDCLDDDNTVEGAVPAVGPDGTIYIAWAGPAGIVLDRSTDGGVTWGADIPVADQPGGWGITIPGIYRSNGFPVTLCDVSLSPHRGTVYVVWSDQRNGMDNTDVFFARSTDGGLFWSSPRRINTDNTISHQFFPWAAVDPVTGTLAVVYYDRSATVGNATDVTLALSRDGGETFTSRIISASSFTPTETVFFGDYSNIVSRGGKIVPIWTRMDGGIRSVWVALVHESPPTAVEGGVADAGPARIAGNYPNPFNASTTIAVTIPGRPGERIPVSLLVFDALGREVRVLLAGLQASGTHHILFDAGPVPSGVYFARLVTPSGSVVHAMTLAR